MTLNTLNIDSWYTFKYFVYCHHNHFKIMIWVS